MRRLEYRYERNVAATRNMREKFLKEVRTLTVERDMLKQSSNMPCGIVGNAATAATGPTATLTRYGIQIQHESIPVPILTGYLPGTTDLVQGTWYHLVPGA